MPHVLYNNKQNLRWEIMFLADNFQIFFPACFWTSGPRLAVKCQAWQPTSHDSNMILPFFFSRGRASPRTDSRKTRRNMMSSRLKGGREAWREERIEGKNDDATEDTSTPIADRIDRDLPSPNHHPLSSFDSCSADLRPLSPLPWGKTSYKLHVARSSPCCKRDLSSQI